VTDNGLDILTYILSWETFSFLLRHIQIGLSAHPALYIQGLFGKITSRELLTKQAIVAKMAPYAIITTFIIVFMHSFIKCIKLSHNGDACFAYETIYGFGLNIVLCQKLTYSSEFRVRRFITISIYTRFLKNDEWYKTVHDMKPYIITIDMFHLENISIQWYTFKEIRNYINDYTML
jgi:hypothetical protein